MPRIVVSTRIDAPPRRVWRVLRTMERHAEWMVDATAIRPATRRRRGVGAAYEVETKVGPFRLVDVMVVDRWRRRKAIGIRHEGLVRGSGLFTLRRSRGGTLFRWEERLRFPWWLGGPLGVAVARPVLRAIWRVDVRNLKRTVEGG
jgi:uncharacterized protein YndB with AHSA1/START domain